MTQANEFLLIQAPSETLESERYKIVSARGSQATVTRSKTLWLMT